MSQTDVALIHIGMHKCASTYLQNVWQAHPGVDLASSPLNKIIEEGRKNGLKGEQMTLLSNPASLGFNLKPRQGRRLVLSNENLSGAYLNDDVSQAQLQAFREFVAVRMKATIPKSKILIVTRRPDKWIISMYNQSIKTGGTWSFRQFLHRKGDFLRKSCNLRELYNTWKQQYGTDNLLVLPLELLAEDEPAFFGQIERFCGIPYAPVELPGQVNPSLDPHSLEVMRRINKFYNLFMRHGRHQGKAPDDIKNAMQFGRMNLRFDLESPTEGIAKRMRRLFPDIKPQHIAPDAVDQALLRDIRAANKKFFKKNDFFGFKSLYC